MTTDMEKLLSCGCRDCIRNIPMQQSIDDSPL